MSATHAPHDLRDLHEKALRRRCTKPPLHQLRSSNRCASNADWNQLTSLIKFISTPRDYSVPVRLPTNSRQAVGRKRSWDAIQDCLRKLEMMSIRLEGEERSGHLHRVQRDLRLSTHPRLERSHQCLHEKALLQYIPYRWLVSQSTCGGSFESDPSLLCR